MKIYWIKAQAPRRVLALAKHLGLDVEFVAMDPNTGALKSPDFAALNPNNKAPVLVDGETVLWESSAIMVYLCNKAGSDMWPTQPNEQIEVLRHGKVRRAQLYYMRNLSGKATRLKERRRSEEAESGGEE